MAILAIVGLGLALVAVGFLLPPALRVAITVLVLVLAGVTLASVRAHNVSEPRLSFRYYGPIEGRIVAIDRSQ